MLINEAGWVAIGFLIFCLIAWRYGLKPFSEMLNDRAQKIKEKLEEAEKLRLEAKEVLLKYKNLHLEAEKDVKKIIDRAKENAKALQLNSQKIAEKNLKRQEEQAIAKINSAENQAIKEINDLTADLSIEASRKILSSNIDNTLDSKSIKQSIKNIHLSS